MSDLPWSRVEEIYHAALERSPELRAGFLAEICAADSDLRREVESLLAQSGDALDTPAWAHITANQEPWLETPLLQTGTALGPYEIIRRIGAGGMGEVYLGRDKRLNRVVALKVLPAYLRLDPARKKRFEREVKTISTLNHPHICTVYDVGQQDGIDFFVMEYLEGDTLAKRLERGHLPIEDVLRHSIEIADALSQAHLHGIIHRDLKPANIMLTKAGAKLLDFGLSKVETPAAASDESSKTAQGAILGTLQYMAPEQLEGKEADARSDIFSFGAIMYEMATGCKAYQGDSQAGLISAIMTSEPKPIAETQPSIPRIFDELVRNCQAKDPGARWQSVHDVLLQLRSIAARARAADTASTHQDRNARSKWIAAACAALLIIAAALFLVRSKEQRTTARPIRLAINPPKGFQIVESDDPEISPDGRTVVFSAAPTGGGAASLWLRPLDSIEARLLPNTEEAHSPFWSPDSHSIAFFSKGKLWRLDLTAGAPLAAICSISTGGEGTWSQDGVIIFVDDWRGNVLWRVPASGGEPSRVFPAETSEQVGAHFLPDGQHFLFLLQAQNEPNRRGIHIGSLDSPRIHRLIGADSPALFAPPDYVFFLDQDRLLAQRFDLHTFVLSGSAVEIVATSNPVTSYSVANDDALIYRTEPPFENELTWYSYTGKRLRIVGTRAPYRQLALSPDSKQIALERLEPRTHTWALCLLNIDTGIVSRFTFNPATNSDPVWSPDGRQIVFASDRNGRLDLYIKAVGGSEEELVYADNDRKVPECWLKDNSILFTKDLGKSFFLLPLTGNREPKLLLHDDFPKDEPHVSPDGRWIAYDSLESGIWEIYVASFPSMANKRQVSTGGGGEPLWSADGRELYYASAFKGTIMAVEVHAGETLETSAPKPLFETHAEMNPVLDQYGVTPDGKKFLVEEPVEHPVLPITVVLNWRETLPSNAR